MKVFESKSGDFKSESTKEGGKWRARLISEGQGSSGYYPAETLKSFGPGAWPKGTHIFFNHLTDTEDWERRGSHDIKDLVGVIESDPEFNESDGGLYAEVKFFSPHDDFMTQVAEHVGLSIEASGEMIEGRVISLDPSPLNAVAVVPRAGRDGKLVQMIESFRESGRMSNEDETKAAGTSVAESTERNPMTEDDIKSLVEAIVPATVAAVVEALKPAEPEAKPEAVDEAAVVESALAADLSASSRKRVVEAVRTGVKPEDAIASEKALRDEILAEAKVEADTPGVKITEGATSTFRPKAW